MDFDFALRDLGFDPSMVAALHDMFDFPEDSEQKHQHPSRAYIRDTKAMKSTPADILEFPNSYQFQIDMPGLKSDQIRVHLEDGNMLVVSGERQREKHKEKAGKEETTAVKYLRIERRFGKLLKKFVLPENANADSISALCQDGVLTVTVDKIPPPEPKKPKVIEVRSTRQEGKAGDVVATSRQEAESGGAATAVKTSQDEDGGSQETKTQ